MGFPAGVLLPVFLLGVIAVDLTFDIGGLPPATTVTYYAGHRTAGFPANTFIILAIAVGSIPYVRALMRPQLTDIISFGVLIVSFIAFVGYLIPVQVRNCKRFDCSPVESPRLRACGCLLGSRSLGFKAVLLTVLCLSTDRKS
jgi:hypothetical protein